MPRKPRNIEPGSDVHTIFRAINRQFLFNSFEAHKIWLSALRRSKKRFQSPLYAWCGMTNHHHLFNQAPTKWNSETPYAIEKGKEDTPLPYGEFLRDTFSFFTRCLNCFKKRRSSLIDDRTKTVNVGDQRQALILLIYIFLNPVRAKIVKHPKDYPHSNFNAYAYGKNPYGKLFQYHPAYLALGKTAKIRRKGFLKLIEEALRAWAGERWAGASGTNGKGRNARIKAWEAFLKVTQSWLIQQLTKGRVPP